MQAYHHVRSCLIHTCAHVLTTTYSTAHWMNYWYVSLDCFRPMFIWGTQPQAYFLGRPPILFSTYIPLVVFLVWNLVVLCSWILLCDVCILISHTSWQSFHNNKPRKYVVNRSLICGHSARMREALARYIGWRIITDVDPFRRKDQDPGIFEQSSEQGKV